MWLLYDMPVSSVQLSFSIKIKFSNNNNNIIKIEVKVMKEINIVNRDFDSFNIQR